MQEHNILFVLAVLKIYETTSSAHPLNAVQIIKKLDEEYHIECNDSRLVYRARRILEGMNYRFESCDEKKKGCYMVGHVSLWESLMRLNNVCQNKSISDKQKRETVEAIKDSLPEEYRRMIAKIPVVQSEIIPFDLKATEYIDVVIKAIYQNKKVVFQYIAYDERMQPYFKHGKIYRINPYMIYPSNDTIYLIGGEQEEDEGIDHLKHFRFDRMFNLYMINEPIIPLEHFTRKNRIGDLAEYVSKCVDNYGGDEVGIELLVTYSEAAMNIIKDKCKRDYNITPVDEKHSIIRFKIRKGPTLIGWLIQNNRFFKVLSPQEIVEELKREYQYGISQYL